MAILKKKEAKTDTAEVWKYIFTRPSTLQYVDRFNEDYQNWMGPEPSALKPVFSSVDQAPQSPRMNTLLYEEQHTRFSGPSLFGKVSGGPGGWGRRGPW